MTQTDRISSFRIFFMTEIEFTRRAHIRLLTQDTSSLLNDCLTALTSAGLRLL